MVVLAVCLFFSSFSYSIEKQRLTDTFHFQINNAVNCHARSLNC